MSDIPSVAIIIPAYDSSSTIRQSLSGFCNQSYPALEIVVVDSSPDDSVSKIIESEFPALIYLHSEKRLLPHAARNLGAQKTTSGLLIFTDPDIYAPPGWVGSLVQAHQRHGGVIIGALTNHTGAWLDWGIHLGKFDAFLSAPEERPLGFCATANMLCSRDDFECAGGFQNGEMLGDLLISWRFKEIGIPILLAPQAAVEHHHTQSFTAFLRERCVRGKDFGRLRIQEFQWTKSRILWHLLITMSGLRLAGLLLREARNSRQAGLTAKFLYTLPVSSTGQVFWLLGETGAYLRALSE
jgi:glycosyltransferase involved in cell wall biosynthesis